MISFHLREDCPNCHIISMAEKELEGKISRVAKRLHDNGVYLTDKPVCKRMLSDILSYADIIKKLSFNPSYYNMTYTYEDIVSKIKSISI